MKKKIKHICVVGGGVGGWFSAAWMSVKHPNIKVTLIESDKVGIIGVGESTLPQLGTMMKEIGLEERDWMSHTNSIYKLGNKFVGWNIEGKRDHAVNHYYCSRWDEQYYGFSYALPEKKITSGLYHPLEKEDLFRNSKGQPGVDDKWNDYWLQLMRDGRKNHWEMAQDMQEGTYLMDYNKAPYDWDDNLLVGTWQGVTYHVDANRFPEIIREKVALPNGVNHVHGHISDIKKDDDGYITSLVTEEGKEYEADLFLDCTGFHRVLTKTMDVPWIDFEDVTTRSLVVAPIKYKDVHKEFRPYTMSNAMDEGWMFVIPLYNRMGAGYVYDETEISKEDAMKKYKKYWDGYEFVQEPQHMSWDAGKYETQWNKNVVSIGMCGSMIEPMEANILGIAQAGFQQCSKLITRAEERDGIIGRGSIHAYNKNLDWLVETIKRFICFHYTLSEREDTPFWAKKKAIGIAENHVEKCWREYRLPANNAESGVPDFMWAMMAVASNKFDDDIKLNTKQHLMEQANEKFSWLRTSAKRNGLNAPNAYEWHKKVLFDDKTHDEVLQENIKKYQKVLRGSKEQGMATPDGTLTSPGN
jgi:tryptophan halogenase